MRRTIQTLDELTAVWERKAYAPAPDGGFELLPEVAAILDAQEAERAAIEAQTLKMKRQLREVTRSNSVYAALSAAGVRPEYRAAASALFQAKTQFVIHDEGDELTVLACDAYGTVSVSSAVAGWLETPSGAPFKPKPQQTRDGCLTAAMRGLRTVH